MAGKKKCRQILHCNGNNPGSAHNYDKKSGKLMAFAKLSDFKNSIDLTFFPQTWEAMKDKIVNEGIYAFKGKVDGSRETPSFLVDSIEDPAQLQQKSITNVHIQVESGFKSVKEIAPLRDFLFGGQGNCYVYFHIDIGGKMYIIKANTQMNVPCTPEFLNDLRETKCVKDVWVD